MLVCFVLLFSFQPMSRLIAHLLEISYPPVTSQIVFFLGFKITLGLACVMLFPFHLFKNNSNLFFVQAGNNVIAFMPKKSVDIETFFIQFF